MNVEYARTKYLLLTITFALFGIIGFAQKKWQKEGIKIAPPICYGSDENHSHFVQAPNEFLSYLKSTGEKKSSIVVEYIGFEAEAQAAFQYAVEIWERLIASPVPIYMTARWLKLNDGVLGSCGPYSFFENFDSAPYKDHYYPVALVEKLEGEEVTDETTPDMIAQFNKDIGNWYFGTDGNTPDGQYDFVSVVLHEIAHGLGFTGFFYAQNGEGAYGDFLPFPGIFDEFIVNSAGDQLVDTALFQNPSAELYQQLKSNNLRYKSETAKSESSNDFYPRLYAPSIFDEGSSIYHLNEFSYSVGDTNSLMTPFFAKAEAIHNPGPFTLGLFADMGWDFTSITHDEIPDMELISAPIQVEAVIKTDSEIDSSSIIFVYSSDSFASTDTIQLIYSEEQNLFSVSLESFGDGTYWYYLSVKDTSNRAYYLPASVPDAYYSFTIGADQEKPKAYHTPVTFMVESDLTNEIVVEATDNIGIEGIVMEYCC